MKFEFFVLVYFSQEGDGTKSPTFIDIVSSSDEEGPGGEGKMWLMMPAICSNDLTEIVRLDPFTKAKQRNHESRVATLLFEEKNRTYVQATHGDAAFFHPGC